MEFTNLQYEGINMGACGKIDLIFMHQAGIRWDELENMILRWQSRRRSKEE